MPCRFNACLAIASISLVLAGCASTLETVLPQTGPSMKAIYDAHFKEMGASDPRVVRAGLKQRPAGNGEGALEGFSRDARNELDTIFPRLPNPTLVMYVFPHLAGDERVPVPGYSTTFPMYERIEYALPGEVPVSR